MSLYDRHELDRKGKLAAGGGLIGLFFGAVDYKKIFRERVHLF